MEFKRIVVSTRNSISIMTMPIIYQDIFRDIIKIYDARDATERKKTIEDREL